MSGEENLHTGGIFKWVSLYLEKSKKEGKYCVVCSTTRPASCNGKDDDFLLSVLVFNFFTCVICLVNVTCVLYSYVQAMKRFCGWWSLGFLSPLIFCLLLYFPSHPSPFDMCQAFQSSCH
jgi:hypothetical protein